MKFVLALAAILAFGLAQAIESSSVGKITHLSGVISVKHPDGSSKVLSVKSDVQPGDVLSTQQETYARVKFVDGAEVVLRPGTQMKVESYTFNEAKPESDSMFLGLLKGGFRAVTGLLGKRNPGRASYSTPTATIGIRGTHFGALFCNNDCGSVATASGQPPANGLHLDVASGAINVKNNGGEQTFNAGQFGFVKDSNTPPVIKPPQDNLQVTMPSSIADNKGSGKGIGKDGSSGCVAQ